MTPTPTEQRPQECEHIHISEYDIAHCSCKNRLTYCFKGKFLMDDCPYYKKCVDGVKACPDFTPKNEKQ